MIPKIIHYAWVGSEVPLKVKKELMSGKKYCLIGNLSFGMSLIMIFLNLNSLIKNICNRIGDTLPMNYDIM